MIVWGHTAFGLLATIVVCVVFGVKVEWQHAVLAVVLSNIVDFDAVWTYIRNDSIAAHAGNLADHRDIAHYPIIVVPCFILTASVFGFFWATVVAANLVTHFVIDSVGVGWGIKWLWPFSKKNYKFLCERDNRSSTRILVSWSPAELRYAIAHYGNIDWLAEYQETWLYRIEIVFCSAMVTIVTITVICNTLY